MTDLPQSVAAYAFFLDIDGTLAPLASKPELACVPQETRAALSALHQKSGGALALVSGRNLADIDQLCGGGFCAAGQHGLELRGADGQVHRRDKHAEVIAIMQRKIRLLGDRYPQLVLEEKGLSIAVHYRQAPELETLIETALEQIAAPYVGIVCVQKGKMVRELRLAEASKGSAIRALMQTSPFLGKQPIFAGDDVTDEEGFAAVNVLGGVSIKIGGGPTQAMHRVANVAAFSHWLHALAVNEADGANSTSLSIPTLDRNKLSATAPASRFYEERYCG